MRKATEGLKNVNNLLMSLIGTPRGSLAVKSNSITDDYKISSNVLGLGINGKVVECFDQVNQRMFHSEFLIRLNHSRRGKSVL